MTVPLKSLVTVGLLSGCTLLVGPIGLLAASPAVPGAVALVVAPPWAAEGGADGVVRAAGGQPVGPTAAPFATLAVLQEPGSVRLHGAWAVFDGRFIAQICGMGPVPED